MSLVSRRTLVHKLVKSKKFRDSYVVENLKRSIPFQIRSMRNEREWSQTQAAKALRKPQSLISRFESPTYGKVTLQTLLEIAQGFDVGLLIKFVPFSRLVKEYDDVSFNALSAKSVSFGEETGALESWASEKEKEEALKEELEIILPMGFVSNAATVSTVDSMSIAKNNVSPISVGMEILPDQTQKPQLELPFGSSAISSVETYSLGEQPNNLERQNQKYRERQNVRRKHASRIDRTRWYKTA